MLPRVVLVRTDVSEERIVSIMKVTRIGELGTTLAVTRNRSILKGTANVVSSSLIRSSETSLLTRVSERNIPENGILQNV
jgi:hypothetical protein